LFIVGLITGNKSTITKETAETACQNYNYDNDKIVNEIGIRFLLIRESLEKNAKFFLHDNNN
jgi:hypothetical protein